MRQMERYVDHQIRAAEELDDKTEQLLTLAIAGIGGGIALSYFVPPAPTVLLGGLPPTAILLVLGFLTNLATVFVLLDAYVGLAPDRAPRIGPGADPEWLAQVTLDPTWKLAHVHHATMKGLRERAIENSNEHRRIGALRRRALMILIVAFVLYGAASLLRWYAQ